MRAGGVRAPRKPKRESIVLRVPTLAAMAATRRTPKRSGGPPRLCAWRCHADRVRRGTRCDRHAAAPPTADCELGRLTGMLRLLGLLVLGRAVRLPLRGPALWGTQAGAVGWRAALPISAGFILLQAMANRGAKSRHGDREDWAV